MPSLREHMRTFALLTGSAGLAVASIGADGPAAASEADPPCLAILHVPTVPAPAHFVLASAGTSRPLIMEVEAGQSVTLAVADGAGDARIIVTGPFRTADAPGDHVAASDPGARRLTFAAPAVPGSYLVRIVQGGKTHVAGEIEVVGVPAALCASEDIEPGGLLTVNWTGPGDPGDRIELFDPVHGVTVDSAAAEGTRTAINRVQVIAPQEIGAYELRYVKPSGTSILAIDVLVWWRTEPGQLRAVETVAPGAEITVQWIGPAKPGHVFRITDQQGGRAPLIQAPRTTLRGAEWARMTAPAQPGLYWLEYAAPGDSGAAARRQLTVGAAQN